MHFFNYFRSVNKNKENDDSMTSNSALLDLKSPGLDFSLPVKNYKIKLKTICYFKKNSQLTSKTRLN